MFQLSRNNIRLKPFPSLKNNRLTSLLSSPSIRHFASAALSNKFKVGEKIGNYQILKTKAYPDFEFNAILLKHVPTGASHLHLESEAKNNVFSVTFQTAPMDSTGVPHILEHTVLCGSKQFPVRDPFFKMLNRSMSTFMNAMTGSDFTMYPFSTQNKKDYYNLMKVYLDAVFHPNLNEMDFKQEGWRLEHADPHDKTSPLIFKGVVFNEMKGALSDQSNLFCTRLQQAMYPDTTYGYVSGGDPIHIPDLTHEQLVEFHRNNYHPSNAKFFTFGSFDLKEQLNYIDDVLSSFDSISTKQIKQVKRFDAPLYLNTSCPPDPVGDPEKQAKMSISFLANDGADVFESMLIKVITSLLINGASSPMYKALLASNIASDYSASTGYDPTARNGMISFGVQGVQPSELPKIENLIMDTLKETYGTGFPPERIDAIMHQMELSLKHKSANFGLVMAQSVLGTWIHDADPLTAMDFNNLLEHLRTALKDPETIKSRIKSIFLDNPHRITFSMEPNISYNDQLAKQEKEKLDSVVKTLTQQDKQKIFEDGHILLELQNAKEDLSCLPTLTVNDINNDGIYYSVKHDTIDANTPIPLQSRITATNGVTYFKVAKSLDDVPSEYYPYLPLFCDALTSLGTKMMSLEELDNNVKLCSGGIGTSVHVHADPSHLGKHHMWLMLGSHYLESPSDQKYSSRIIDLMSEVVTSAAWHDKDRLFTVLSGMQSDYGNSLAGSGHRFAVTASSKTGTASLGIQEQLGGLSQVGFLNTLMPDESPEELDDVVTKLQEMARIIFQTPSQVKVSVNATENGNEEFKHVINKLLNNIKSFPSNETHENTNSTLDTPISHIRELFASPFAVNYCAQSLVAVPYVHNDSPALQLLSSMLTSNFLHREVREKGGAYGGGARFSALEGVMSLWSYRDPYPERTLETFKKTFDYAHSIKSHLGQRELNEAKLSVFQSIDSPVSPASEGSSLFKLGITKEMRQKRRQLLLSSTLEDIEKVAQKYLHPDQYSIVVLGTQEAIKKLESNPGMNWVKHSL